MRAFTHGRTHRAGTTHAGTYAHKKDVLLILNSFSKRNGEFLENLKGIEILFFVSLCRSRAYFTERKMKLKKEEDTLLLDNPALVYLCTKTLSYFHPSVCPSVPQSFLLFLSRYCGTFVLTKRFALVNGLQVSRPHLLHFFSTTKTYLEFRSPRIIQLARIE